MRLIRYPLAGTTLVVCAGALYSFMNVYLLLLTESLDPTSHSVPVDSALAIPWLAVAVITGLSGFALLRSLHKEPQRVAKTEAVHVQHSASAI